MSLTKTVQGITIACVMGDITDQVDMEGVVNAANRDLRRGGGVAGAIHRAAGPGLEEECIPLAPIETGDAVITGGHGLPNKYVIHTLGPIYQAEVDPRRQLEKAYTHSLLVADKTGLTSLAFPAISTGIFGYPFAEGAQVAMETVKMVLPRLSSLTAIRFVLYGEDSYQAFAEAFENTFGEE